MNKLNKVKYIKKANGKMDLYNPQKFHAKTSYSVQGLQGVSQSEIEIGAAHSILEGTTSAQIQDALINSAKNLTSKDSPDYQVAAARLLNQKIRKEAHGNWNPLSLLEITEKNKDIYDLKTLYSAYTKEELEWFGTKIDYSKDNDFVFGGLDQMQKAYLSKRNDKIQESSQEVFMLVSLFAFHKYEPKQRKEIVLNTYKALSTFEISLPTPTMVQLRTKFNRYFSCNIIDSGDSKGTIANAARSIYEIVASGAGIGISYVDLRELNADIDNGRLKHTGTLPIVKSYTKDTKAFVQPTRGGCHFLDTEVEILVNNEFKKIKIQDVKVNDYIKSYNIKKNKIEPKRVTEIIRPIVEVNDQLKISTNNGYIINSKKHPILVKKNNEFNYIKAKELKVGDILLTSENKEEQITNIIEPKLDTQFYDLTVKDNNNFFAGYNTMYCGHNSSTGYKNFYSMEIEDWLVWGNNKGTEETRERDTDYCIVFNDLFFERYKHNKDITLFYANDVPRLSSYMGDTEKFTELYLHYEKTVPKRKQKKISAESLFNLFLNERFLQARVYAAFAENLSARSSFKVPIKVSNLCTEIGVPIMPIYDTINIKKDIYFSSLNNKEMFYKLRQELLFNSTDEKKLRKLVKEMRKYYHFEKPIALTDEDIKPGINSLKAYDYFDLDDYVNPSEIGVCILAGVNLGMITDERIPIVMDLLVRLLEELIDMNEYDLTETEKAAKMRRTCGIGFSDVFHDLARNKVFYNTQEGRQFISDRIELATFSGIKTSIELAKERGPCVLLSDTKYADGLVPIDYSSEHVSELLETRTKQDWNSIRTELKKYGIRHSTLFANPPFGASSRVSNATPGIEPPRELAGIKSGVPKLVPEIKKFGKYYTTAWSEEFNNIDYFKFIGVVQQWFDQTISVNQYTNLMKYPDGKVPLKVLATEMLTLRKYGGNTAYYQNTRSTNQADGLEEDELEQSNTSKPPSLQEIQSLETECSGGGCSI